MTINYKKLNDNSIFDGYNIFNKTVLFNIIKGASWSSKMDCKSGYQEIKMDEERIPLIAFSSPEGHYEWLVLPFDLKTHFKYFKEE